MKAIEDKICIWKRYSVARFKELTIRNRNFDDCFVCNGKNENCEKYYGSYQTWSMKQDTKPYEETHGRYNKP